MPATGRKLAFRVVREGVVHVDSPDVGILGIHPDGEVEVFRFSSIPFEPAIL
jgi:hypothetical protein